MTDQELFIIFQYIQCICTITICMHIIIQCTMWCLFSEGRNLVFKWVQTNASVFFRHFVDAAKHLIEFLSGPQYRRQWWLLVANPLPLIAHTSTSPSHAASENRKLSVAAAILRSFSVSSWITWLPSSVSVARLLRLFKSSVVFLDISCVKLKVYYNKKEIFHKRLYFHRIISWPYV